MIELQAGQLQDPRSFWELQRHGEIRAIARRVIAAVSNLFQWVFRIVSEGWCQLRDRVITLLPKKTDQNVKNISIETVAAVLRVEFPQELATIPADQKEEVIRLSCLLITSGTMTDYGINEILHEVAATPADQREEVVRIALLAPITPETTGYDLAERIRTIVAISVDQREEMIRNNAVLLLPRDQRVDDDHNTRMSVHSIGRDARVKAAIELLFKHQKNVTVNEIREAKDEFIAYLEKSPIDKTKKDLAQGALLEQRKNTREFGPLIDDKGFTMANLSLSGADLIGRFWIFASKQTGIEQTNARVGVISALSNSYDDEGKVCNPGKVQRLIVSVLQGRLPGVNIEGDGILISAHQAMEMFFSNEAHRKIDKWEKLMEAANQFCVDNEYVRKDTFIPEIEKYARLQGIKK